MNKELFDIIEHDLLKQTEEDSAAHEGRGIPADGDTATEAFREELLGRIVRLEDKASRAFLCIEEQREQLQVLEDFLNGQERQREQHRAAVQERRKMRRLVGRLSLGGTLLGLTLIWAEGIAELGWRVFQEGTELLNVQPADAVGFATSAAIALLLYFFGRMTVSVIRDDFLDGEV